jgi:aspartate--ammonia ligase
MSLIIPSHYRQKLLPETTEIAIKLIKERFQEKLARSLRLRRVTAPLFVQSGTGFNDDLNGVEHAVKFHAKAMGVDAEVVHSLAKWKRAKLAAYGVAPGFGIYTDMNAIRADEEPDNLHSLYVDQWDWEKTITSADRTLAYLEATVKKIYTAVKEVEEIVYEEFPHITPTLPDDIMIYHAEELAQRYKHLTPREREAKIARKNGAVFIVGIGGRLSDGAPHDLRAPDYDDWTTPNARGFNGLNGDIILWNNVLECPFELSSMGIRVDAKALVKQLNLTGHSERRSLNFHRRLLAGEFPDSIGGGIGQSRLCMYLLQKAHIGEVQASLWPESQIEACHRAGSELL